MQFFSTFALLDTEFGSVLVLKINDYVPVYQNIATELNGVKALFFGGEDCILGKETMYLVGRKMPYGKEGYGGPEATDIAHG